VRLWPFSEFPRCLLLRRYCGHADINAPAELPDLAGPQPAPRPTGTTATRASCSRARPRCGGATYPRLTNGMRSRSPLRSRSRRGPSGGNRVSGARRGVRGRGARRWHPWAKIFHGQLARLLYLTTSSTGELAELCGAHHSIPGACARLDQTGRTLSETAS
jgi:hypothetical protein